MVIVYDYHYNAYYFLCCDMVASNFSHNCRLSIPKKFTYVTNLTQGTSFEMC